MRVNSHVAANCAHMSPYPEQTQIKVTCRMSAVSNPSTQKIADSQCIGQAACKTECPYPDAEMLVQQGFGPSCEMQGCFMHLAHTPSHRLIDRDRHRPIAGRQAPPLDLLASPAAIANAPALL